MSDVEAAASEETSPASPAGEEPRPRPRRRLARRVPESGALVVVLLALVTFFSLKSPFFFNTDNFINILIASAVVGIVACPATMLLVAGQFDLSVGGATALVTVTFAESFVDGRPLVVSILVASSCP